MLMLSMIVSRTLSTPVCEAASISSTSIERLSAISLHEGQASGSSGDRGRIRLGRFVAIQGFGEQPRGRCFADAARAGKEISVMQPVVLDRVAQRARDRFLPGDFVKCLRAPFAGDYLIGHKI